MPRLWTDTIETHRHEVRGAILDAAQALVRDHGLRAATMSRIAKEAGIGRATLYKYFPDAEAVMHAGHEQHVTEHLDRLTKLASGKGSADARLEAVLAGYARICHHRAQGDADLSALVHRGEMVAGAERQLWTLFRDLLAEAASGGGVRADIAPDELASFSLHALSAAGSVPSETAAARLVVVTLAALRATPSV